jgi:hypothetical protein
MYFFLKLLIFEVAKLNIISNSKTCFYITWIVSSCILERGSLIIALLPKAPFFEIVF